MEALGARPIDHVPFTVIPTKVVVGCCVRNCLEILRGHRNNRLGHEVLLSRLIENRYQLRLFLRRWLGLSIEEARVSQTDGVEVLEGGFEAKAGCEFRAPCKKNPVPHGCFDLRVVFRLKAIAEIRRFVARVERITAPGLVGE